MEENNKKEPVQPENGMMDKAKDLLDKAEDMLEESFDKVKKSKAFESVSEAYKKAEDFVEDKIEDFEKSGTKEKLESMADNAGEKANNAFRKIKDLGKDLAEKAEAKIEEMSGKSKGKPKV